MAQPTEKGVETPKNIELDKRSLFYKWLLNLWASYPKTQTFSAILNPTSVAANTTAEQSFSVKGLTAQDIVTVIKPSHTAGLILGSARVSAADTLSIQFGNVTGSPIDPPSETYLISSVRL